MASLYLSQRANIHQKVQHLALTMNTRAQGLPLPSNLVQQPLLWWEILQVGKQLSLVLHLQLSVDDVGPEYLCVTAWIFISRPHVLWIVLNSPGSKHWGLLLKAPWLQTNDTGLKILSSHRLISKQYSFRELIQPCLQENMWPAVLARNKWTAPPSTIYCPIFVWWHNAKVLR